MKPLAPVTRTTSEALLSRPGPLRSPSVINSAILPKRVACATAKTTPSHRSICLCGQSLAQLASMSRSEEHTSELQSLMRISYAVFCLKKKKTSHKQHNTILQYYNTNS